MKHGRDHFTGNLVHVGIINQQSLTAVNVVVKHSKKGTMYAPAAPASD